MKSFIKQFVFRGLICASGGPLILAVIYSVLELTNTVTTLTPGEVSLGIFTISILAFIAAGCTALYQVDQLSVFQAALIHGAALYLGYLLIYMVNGWLIPELTAIMIFTGIFIAGYALVWLVIYLVTKRSAEKLNEQLQQ